MVDHPPGPAWAWRSSSSWAGLRAPAAASATALISAGAQTPRVAAVSDWGRSRGRRATEGASPGRWPENRPGGPNVPLGVTVPSSRWQRVSAPLAATPPSGGLVSGERFGGELDQCRTPPQCQCGHEIGLGVGMMAIGRFRPRPDRQTLEEKGVQGVIVDFEDVARRAGGESTDVTARGTLSGRGKHPS